MERLRTLIAAKLGRCSRCMRWSGRGTLAGWGSLGVAYLVWPEPLVLMAIAIVSGAFSLLLLAHAVRFGARFATAVTEHRAADEEPARTGFDRRSFLGLAARGGVAGLALSLFGRIPVALAQETCAGQHAQSMPFVATSPADCRAQAREAIHTGFCDGICSLLTGCTAPQTCVNERGPGRIADITFTEGTGECTATVICFCACG